MRKRGLIGGLLVTALSGLLLATGTPANAEHPTISTRIADIDSRTFATAHTNTRLVTMEPPVTSVGFQHWYVEDEHVPSGIRVVNVGTGGCLTPEPGSSATRPAIIQRPCQGTATEYWRIVSPTTDIVIFRNVGRDGCMTIDPTSTTPSRLYLAPCQNDNRNQHFRLVA